MSRDLEGRHGDVDEAEVGAGHEVNERLPVPDVFPVQHLAQVYAPGFVLGRRQVVPRWVMVL